MGRERERKEESRRIYFLLLLLGFSKYFFLNQLQTLAKQSRKDGGDWYIMWWISVRTLPMRFGVTVCHFCYSRHLRARGHSDSVGHSEGEQHRRRAW